MWEEKGVIHSLCSLRLHQTAWGFELATLPVMRPVFLWSCPGVKGMTATVETDHNGSNTPKEKKRWLS